MLVKPLQYKSFGKEGFGRDIEIGAVPVLGIAGPSGIGKSTLIRSLAFLEPSLKGELWCSEKLLWEHGTVIDPQFTSVKESFGFIFQDLYLWDHLSVIKNVTLALTAHKKLSGTEAEQKAMILLNAFDLAGYRDRRPTEISGGEAQRLAWVRALVMDPKIIFMDEPSSSLDSKTRDECFASVRELYPDMKFVIVSHDLEWLGASADNIVHLTKESLKL